MMYAFLLGVNDNGDDTVSFSLWKALLVLAIIALIVYIFRLRHRP